jgi:hypothetical protein
MELARVTVLKEKQFVAKLNVILSMGTLLITRIISLHRGELLSVLLGPVFMFGGASNPQTKRQKLLWLLATPCIAAFWFVLVMVRGFNQNLEYGLESLFYRWTYIPVHETLAHLATFPDFVDFRGLRTISYYSYLVDGTFKPAYVFVREAMYPTSYDNYVCSASFVGDLWAGYGLPGVIIGSFLLGGYLIAIDRWLLSKGTVGAWAVHAAVCAGTYYLAEGALVTTMFSMGVGTVPLAYAFFRMLAQSGPFSRLRKRTGASSAVAVSGATMSR